MPFQHPYIGWNPFSPLPVLPAVCFSTAVAEEILVISETHHCVGTRTLISSRQFDN